MKIPLLVVPPLTLGVLSLITLADAIKGEPLVPFDALQLVGAIAEFVLAIVYACYATTEINQ